MSDSYNVYRILYVKWSLYEDFGIFIRSCLPIVTNRVLCL